MDVQKLITERLAEESYRDNVSQGGLQAKVNIENTKTTKNINSNNSSNMQVFNSNNGRQSSKKTQPSNGRKSLSAQLVNLAQSVDEIVDLSKPETTECLTPKDMAEMVSKDKPLVWTDEDDEYNTRVLNKQAEIEKSKDKALKKKEKFSKKFFSKPSKFRAQASDIHVPSLPTKSTKVETVSEELPKKSVYSNNHYPYWKPGSKKMKENFPGLVKGRFDYKKKTDSYRKEINDVKQKVQIVEKKKKTTIYNRPYPDWTYTSMEHWGLEHADARVPWPKVELDDNKCQNGPEDLITPSDLSNPDSHYNRELMVNTAAERCKTVLTYNKEQSEGDYLNITLDVTVEQLHRISLALNLPGVLDNDNNIVQGYTTETLNSILSSIAAPFKFVANKSKKGFTMVHEHVHKLDLESFKKVFADVKGSLGTLNILEKFISFILCSVAVWRIENNVDRLMVILCWLTATGVPGVIVSAFQNIKDKYRPDQQEFDAKTESDDDKGLVDMFFTLIKYWAGAAKKVSATAASKFASALRNHILLGKEIGKLIVYCKDAVLRALKYFEFWVDPDEKRVEDDLKILVAWTTTADKIMTRKAHEQLLGNPNFAKEVDEHLARGIALKNMLARTAIASRLQSTLFVTTLTKLWQFRDVSMSQALRDLPRTSPVCVFIYGEPGLGKTTFVEEVAKQLYQWKYNKEVSLSQAAFHKNFASEYWEGYQYQLSLILDDPFQFNRNDDSAEKMVEINQLCHRGAFQFNMAHLENKAGTFMRSEFVFVTSNKPPSDTAFASLVQDPKAFLRRWDFILKCSKKSGKQVYKRKDRDPKEINFDGLVFTRMNIDDKGKEEVEYQMDANTVFSAICERHVEKVEKDKVMDVKVKKFETKVLPPSLDGIPKSGISTATIENEFRVNPKLFDDDNEDYTVFDEYLREIKGKSGKEEVDSDNEAESSDNEVNLRFSDSDDEEGSKTKIDKGYNKTQAGSLWDEFLAKEITGAREADDFAREKNLTPEEVLKMAYLKRIMNRISKTQLQKAESLVDQLTASMKALDMEKLFMEYEKFSRGDIRAMIDKCQAQTQRVSSYHYYKALVLYSKNSQQTPDLFFQDIYAETQRELKELCLDLATGQKYSPDVYIDVLKKYYSLFSNLYSVAHNIDGNRDAFEAIHQSWYGIPVLSAITTVPKQTTKLYSIVVNLRNAVVCGTWKSVILGLNLVLGVLGVCGTLAIPLLGYSAYKKYTANEPMVTTAKEVINDVWFWVNEKTKKIVAIPGKLLGLWSNGDINPDDLKDYSEIEVQSRYPDWKQRRVGGKKSQKWIRSGVHEHTINRVEMDTTGAVVQSGDLAGVQLAQSLQKNLVTIKWADSKLGVGTSVQALFIKGRECLVPKHILNLKSAPGQHLIFEDERLGKCFTYNYDDLIMYTVGPDCVYIKIEDNRFPEYKNITGNFITDHELELLRTFDCAIAAKIGSTFVPCIAKAEIRKSIGYTCDLANIRYEIDRHVRYQGTTYPGSCGSPYVVLVKKVQNKILGFHVAGSVAGNYGIGYIITQGDIRKIFDSVKTQSGGLVFKDPVEYIGRVEPDQYKFFNKKVNIQPTCVYGKFQEPKHKPVDPEPRYVGEEYIDPVQKAFSKFSKERVVPNDEDLKIFKKCIRHYLKTKISLTRDYMGFSRDVALNGHPISDHMPALNMQAAPGRVLIDGKLAKSMYDLIYCENCNQKPCLCTNRHLKCTPEFERHMQEYEYNLNFRESPGMADWNIKAETKKNADVDQGKVRLFAVVPKDNIIMSKQFFGPLVIAMNEAGLKGHMASFINPHGAEWGEAWRYIHPNKLWKPKDGDFAGFDLCHREPQCRITVEEILKYFDRSHEFYREVPDEVYAKHRIKMKNLLYGTFNGIHVIMNLLFRACCNPSGGYLTVHYNNIINIGLNMAAAVMYGRDNGLPIYPHTYDELFHLLVGGDDNFETTILHYPLKAKADNMRKLGYEYTTGDKKLITDETPETEIENVTFLKRRFVPYNSYVLAPLDIDTLLDIPHWAASKNNNEDTTKQAIETMLLEFFHYGPDEYKKRCNQARNIWYETTGKTNLVIFPWIDLYRNFAMEGKLKDMEEYIIDSFDLKPQMDIQKDEVVLEKQDQKETTELMEVAEIVEDKDLEESVWQSEEVEVYEDPTPKHFIERQFPLESITYSASTVPWSLLKEWNFPEDLHNSTFQAFLNRTFMMATDIQFELRGNFTQFQYGLLAVVWLPLYKNNASRFLREDIRDIMNGGNYMLMNVNTRESLKFNIPFRTPLLGIRNDAVTGAMGALRVYALTALHDPSCETPASVELLPFFNLYNTKMSGFKAQSGGPENKEALKKSKIKLSTIFDTASKISGSFKSFPRVGKIAESASSAFELGSKVSRYFGLSNTRDLTGVSKVQPTLFGNISNAHGTDNSVVLALGAESHVANHHKLYRDDRDYDLWDNYKLLPGFVGSVSIPSNTQPGVVVWEKHLEYLASDYGSNFDRMAPCDILKAFSGYSREGKKFMFEFVGNAFFNARFRLYYTPPANQNAVTRFNVGNLVSEVIDVQGPTTYCVTVPYYQTIGYISNSVPGIQSHNYEDGIGTLYLQLITPIQTYGCTTTDFYVFIFGSADESSCYSCPRRPRRNPKVHNLSLWDIESKKEPEEEEEEEENIVQSGKAINRVRGKDRVRPHATHSHVNVREFFKTPFPPLGNHNISLPDKYYMSDHITRWTEVFSRPVQVLEVVSSNDSTMQYSWDDLCSDDNDLFNWPFSLFNGSCGSIRYKVLVASDYPFTIQVKNDSFIGSPDVGDLFEGGMMASSKIRPTIEFTIPYYSPYLFRTPNFPNYFDRYRSGFLLDIVFDDYQPHQYTLTMWASFGDDFSLGIPMNVCNSELLTVPQLISKNKTLKSLHSHPLPHAMSPDGEPPEE